MQHDVADGFWKYGIDGNGPLSVQGGRRKKKKKRKEKVRVRRRYNVCWTRSGVVVQGLEFYQQLVRWEQTLKYVSRHLETNCMHMRAQVFNKR